MTDLSVIIVNYNVAYFLEQCLHSVFRAKGNLNLEVFVVDNNSVDGSVAMVRKKFPQARLIANRENLGFSKANNQAMRMANGRYILLLNPDTLVEEDTFRSTIAYMDEHPEVGGLGVKMIDGKGRFLPESKRGLPTPAVAFFKIFGLSSLFPKSRLFGKYHLGYLDRDEIHQIDVLSGAFMLMRKEALDKVGLLDESFFMYGEDIDLSYRITKGGYSNIYFPKTRIIHYKGESTKKSSINYVFVFYRAMVIFARKHFSRSHAKTFGFLINLAIYFRAGLAILHRFLRSIWVYLLDLGVLIGALILLKSLYAGATGIYYEESLVLVAFVCYSLIWIASVFLNGGYDRPISFAKIFRGIGIGTLIILITYALLPEDLRFSRALILLGTLSTSVYYALSRALMKALTPESIPSQNQKIGIVAGEEEFERIDGLLNDTGFRQVKPMRISPERDSLGESAHADRLKEIIDVYQFHTVIFSGQDVPSHRIIGLMSDIDVKGLQFKIAPPESAYIIGSNSIEKGGEIFMMDLNAITRVTNRRRKRFMDILVSLFLLILSPILIWGVEEKVGFVKNCISVLGGRYSWVGYAPGADERRLPNIPPGILNPLDGIKFLKSPAETARKLNAIYAREYGLRKDLAIISAGYRHWGRTPLRPAIEL